MVRRVGGESGWFCSSVRSMLLLAPNPQGRQEEDEEGKCYYSCFSVETVAESQENRTKN